MIDFLMPDFNNYQENTLKNLNQGTMAQSVDVWPSAPNWQKAGGV